MNSIQHILIIGFVWPEPNSSAGGTRTMQLIELFQKQGWKITFASVAADSEYAFDLKSLNIQKVTIELNNKNFDEFIKKLQPTIVIFDRFYTEEQFGWRVAENCPNALRVLDTIDLHCLRIARQKAVKENHPFTFDDLNSDTAKREIASIYRSDISLMISEVEMEILHNHFKVDNNLLYYLPFLLDEIETKTIESWPSFEERNHFISIGNFLHEPNWDSVVYLKKEIWPLIRKELKDAELHIYGAYPSQKVNDLNNPKEGFIVKGRAKHVNEVMQHAKVCLAPLRFGAGIKGKLIDAMLNGTPSVTTSVGAESMHKKLEWNGLIADKPQEIANAAIELHTNKENWLKAQKNGIEIIESCYSKKAGKLFIEHILAIQKNINEHRKNNFTGAMLMHHTMNSTKYMSQWIEEKNKISN